MPRIFVSVLETTASISSRDVDGNSEVSLPDLTILALYRGQHYLVARAP